MSEQKWSILIVDDEKSIRRSLRAYLEDEGFEVMDAGTAEEGLDVLARVSAHAVIVDLRLTGMDGNAFIERAHELHPETRFFVYTGSVGYQPPPNLQAIGVGEEQVFTKPMKDMSLLVRAMRSLMDVRRVG
ncbi:MAG: response regulator [Syntrophobacteraceae bacterium]